MVAHCVDELPQGEVLPNDVVGEVGLEAVAHARSEMGVPWLIESETVHGLCGWDIPVKPLYRSDPTTASTAPAENKSIGGQQLRGQQRSDATNSLRPQCIVLL